MEFIVKGKEKTIKLDRFQLLDIIVGEVLTKQKSEFPAMATAFTSMMQQRGTLGQFNLDQLVTTSFALGYFFRIFLEKNEVSIVQTTNEEVTDELDGTSTNEPTGEVSSNVSS